MDKTSLGKVKSISQDERFEALESLAEELKIKWNAEKKKKETEFDTIWELAYLEGKVEGLTDYFKNISETNA